MTFQKKTVWCILKSTLGSKYLDEIYCLLLNRKMNNEDAFDHCRQFGKTQEVEDTTALDLLKSGVTAEVSNPV